MSVRMSLSNYVLFFSYLFYRANKWNNYKIIGQSLVNIISKIKHFNEIVIIFDMHMVVRCYIMENNFFSSFFECD